MTQVNDMETVHWAKLVRQAQASSWHHGPPKDICQPKGMTRRFRTNNWNQQPRCQHWNASINCILLARWNINSQRNIRHVYSLASLVEYIHLQTNIWSQSKSVPFVFGQWSCRWSFSQLAKISDRPSLRYVSNAFFSRKLGMLQLLKLIGQKYDLL